MLYFWASWCSACQKENPMLVGMYNKYKGKGFDIYAVSLDSDETEWISAIESSKLTWKNVSELNGLESEVAKTYEIWATPTIYLLDNKMRIISKGLTGSELEMKLMAMFN